MLSPSDYNDAVPQFENGNYASAPLNPLYVEEPNATDYRKGVEPIQTLPAQWWNWLCNKFTSKFNKLNIYVKNIFDELAQLLSLVGLTPDATEEELTTGQLKGMFQTEYPNYLKEHYSTDTAVENGTKFFTTGGMYNFTLESKYFYEWLGKVFGYSLCQRWNRAEVVNKGFYQVAYNNGIWVGRGTTGLYYSLNGKNWYSTNNTTTVFKSVSYGGGLWTAGAVSAIWWSEDGITWTAGTMTVIGVSYRAPSFGNGLWVAGTSNGSICWSEDGKNWSSLVTLSSGAIEVYTPTFANNMWVTGGYNIGMWWSTDGKTWTHGTGQTSNIGYPPVYANGIWVASCNKPAQSGAGMWWSTDGKAWTQGTGGNETYNHDAPVFINGRFYVGATSHGMWYSFDGKSWSQVSILTTSSVYTPSYAFGLYVAFSDYYVILSTDGINWRGIKNNLRLHDAVFGGSIWVAPNNVNEKYIYWSDFTLVNVDRDNLLWVTPRQYN